RGRGRDGRREPRRHCFHRGTGRGRRRRDRHHWRVDRKGRRELIASPLSQKVAIGLAIWGHSSVGRAREWHSRGRGFDSPWLHQSSLATARRAIRNTPRGGQIQAIISIAFAKIASLGV